MTTEKQEKEGEEQLVVLRSVRMSALALSGVSGHRLALSVTPLPPPPSLSLLTPRREGGREWLACGRWGGAACMKGAVP